MKEESADGFPGEGGAGGGGGDSSEQSQSQSADDQTGDHDDSKPSRTGTARKRIIDETLLPEEEARQLEARRAYNRQCAAKARKRSKDLISTLQKQVEELTKDKTTLERANEVMKAQLQFLEQQNRTLMMNQQRAAAAPPMMGGFAGPAGQFMGGFQGGNPTSGGFPVSLNALQGRITGETQPQQQGSIGIHHQQQQQQQQHHHLSQQQMQGQAHVDGGVYDPSKYSQV